MKKAIKIIFQLIVALLILMLLASLVTGSMILFRGLGTRGNFTYMIVLGTVVEGSEPSAMLQDRIEAAAKYMEKNPDVISVVTGYQAEGTNISEAECMYNGLVELGIDPSRILVEDKATSTRENFQFSVELLEEELGRTPKNVGVLSSEFHLLRAQMLAKHHGLNAAVIPANTSDMNTFFKFFLREILMVWYDGLYVVMN